MTRQQMIRGCLLGGAVGDALGADIEFMNLDEIREVYGPDGVVDYPGDRGEFTDDTQLTLFTAEGLLEGGDRLTNLHRAYLRWYITQGGRPQLGMGPSAGLLTVAGMHQRRAPGTTCLGALSTGWVLGRRAANNSKGCGGVMRVAPIGLFAPCIGNDRAVFELANDAARLTHGHPSGHLPAGCLAAMIASLMRGAPMLDAVTNAAALACIHPGADETLRAIGAAVELASEGPPRPEQLEKLGGGWVGEEALAISIACALSATSFADGVLMAVNHSGDCDSTAAITGNLLGALHGVDGIPSSWLDRLELRETVELYAAKLYAATEKTPLEATGQLDKR